jgi:hypothetical protein
VGHADKSTSDCINIFDPSHPVGRGRVTAKLPPAFQSQPSRPRGHGRRRAEQDNLHPARSAFGTVTTRAESAIRREEALLSSHAL